MDGGRRAADWEALISRSQIGLDDYRARASCWTIAPDDKVRAWLVRDAGPDYFSSWFTAVNVYYYTGWRTCAAGCRSAYQVSGV